MMRPDVRAVPVAVVREKYDLRRLLAQNVSDAFDRFLPLRRIGGARLEINSFQAIRTRLDQSEPDVVAAGAQLLPSLRLPGFTAALRDGHVEDMKTRLPHQSQRQPADDDFIVRMRREDQCFGCISGT